MLFSCMGLLHKKGQAESKQCNCAGQWDSQSRSGQQRNGQRRNSSPARDNGTIRAGAGLYPGGQNEMNAWMYLTKHMRKAGHFSGSHSRKNASACLSISFLQNEMRVSEGARLKHMQVLVHPREELFCPKDKSREGSSFSPIFFTRRGTPSQSSRYWSRPVRTPP